jgi:hypothetical protein
MRELSEIPDLETVLPAIVRAARSGTRAPRLRSILSTCRPGVRLCLPLDVVVSEASGRRAGYSVVPWTI